MTTLTPTLLESGVWTVDDAASHVGFSIRHLGVATVHGRFHVFGGVVADNGGDSLRLDARVAAGSIDTGNAIRDRRLREEVFDTTAFPVIAFGARVPGPPPDGEWLLAGTLGMRGVVRPVVLRALAAPGDDGAVRVALRGELLRSDFGLDAPALRSAGRRLVADRVRLDVAVTLTRTTP